MNPEPGPGPFEGVRVLELGQYISVPYCGELFAHGGAIVTKVEPTTGDQTRHNSAIFPGEGRQYINKARGKRGIALNLGSPEGLALVKRMADASDVVLSNLRPGLPERLGLDYESLSATNPGLVYGEVTAFGHHGPEGDKPGLDITAQAMSGLMLSLRAFDGTRPIATDVMITDYLAGTLLAFGIASALRVRDTTGKGQKVATSLFQAGLAVQNHGASIIEAVDSWKHDFVDWLETEKPTAQAGAVRRQEQMGSGQWFFNTYEAADGALAIAAPGILRRKLLEVMGFDEPSVTDPNWEQPDDPRPHFAAVVATMRERVAGWKRDELIAALEAAAIPCSRVHFLEEALVSEQARANGFVSTFDHPRVGPITMPTTPLTFSSSGYRSAETTPGLGEQTRAVLSDLGLADSEVEKLIADGVVVAE